MEFRMPIQIGTDNLFENQGTNQDPATRAWNMSVGLYYKGGGVPWRFKTDGPETCFVGISFHHLRTPQQHFVYSSLAQAFSKPVAKDLHYAAKLFLGMKNRGVMCI